MKSAELTEALRRARPSVSLGWSGSPEGRDVLAEVLDTQRVAAPIAARRRSARPLLAGAVAVLVAVGVLVSTQLIADRGADVGRQIPGVDTYRAADVAFFGPPGVDAAVREVERYETIEGAARSASAVIVGEVVDVRHTRTVYGEEPSWDRIPMIGVVVRPVEVLRGELPDEFAQQLTVEGMGSGDPREAIEQRRRSLPEGKQVWFLRAKTKEVEQLKDYLAKQGRKLTEQEIALYEAEKEYYRLTSSQGLFLQGEDHVVNPIASKVTLPANTMTAEGERYRYLSELIEAIRAGR